MQFIFFVYTFFFINIYYYYSLKIYIKAYNTDMLHLSSGGKKVEEEGGWFMIQYSLTATKIPNVDITLIICTDHFGIAQSNCGDGSCAWLK